MKIQRTTNNGVPSREIEELEVSGFNIDPETIVAVPDPGTEIELDRFENYDTFNVTRTSGSSDRIVIPSGLPVGSVFRLITDGDALEIFSPDDINGNGSTAFSAQVNSILIFMKKAEGVITAFQLASDGTPTAVDAS